MLAYHQWKDIKKLEDDPQVKEERVQGILKYFSGHRSIGLCYYPCLQKWRLRLSDCIGLSNCHRSQQEHVVNKQTGSEIEKSSAFCNTVIQCLPFPEKGRYGK